MPIIITVKGMSCGHCEETVVEALRTVRGVTAATVDRATDQARVEGEADVDVDALVRAVEDAGYAASA